jgi:arabinose-5-phosphate isomerase
LNSYFINRILLKFAPHKDINFFLTNKFNSKTILIPDKNIIESAKKTILSESKSIERLAHFIDNSFVYATKLIFDCKTRIVITGIGKSAIIAQKIVASMNSTGTPSMFLHASEAIHGDLGMVQKGDVVICISKSGNSPEIKVLVQIINNFGNKLIAITGNIDSFLAKNSNFVLNTTVESESCPNNLAPTDSTTAQLVMGDALTVCLMEMRDFQPQDFAKYHPGGALGKKLLLRVNDMLENTLKPSVLADANIKKVIFEISEKRLGVTAVLENEKVIGIITDGDIRRMLNENDSFSHLTAKDIMTKNPKLIEFDSKVIDAFQILEKYKITQLVVVENNIYKGVLHLHDILKEGIV